MHNVKKSWTNFKIIRINPLILFLLIFISLTIKINKINMYLWLMISRPMCLFDLKNKITAVCNQIIKEQVISGNKKKLLSRIHIECSLQHHNSNNMLDK